MMPFDPTTVPVVSGLVRVESSSLGELALGKPMRAIADAAVRWEADSGADFSVRPRDLGGGHPPGPGDQP